MDVYLNGRPRARVESDGHDIATLVSAVAGRRNTKVSVAALAMRHVRARGAALVGDPGQATITFGTRADCTYDALHPEKLLVADGVDLLAAAAGEHHDVTAAVGGIATAFNQLVRFDGLLTIKGAGTKAFSLASAPDDDAVAIGTRLRSGSAYKQALAALRPGDRISMRGPILRFTLEGASSEVVFLAQGVGITLFRSLPRHVSLRRLPVRTTLVHVANGHPFHGETRGLAHDARYPRTREDFAIDLKQVTADQPTASYFVSGTPDFVSTTSRSLKDVGVAGRQIRKDTCRGY